MATMVVATPAATAANGDSGRLVGGSGYGGTTVDDRGGIRRGVDETRRRILGASSEPGSEPDCHPDHDQHDDRQQHDERCTGSCLQRLEVLGDAALAVRPLTLVPPQEHARRGPQPGSRAEARRHDEDDDHPLIVQRRC